MNQTKCFETWQLPGNVAKDWFCRRESESGLSWTLKKKNLEQCFSADLAHYKNVHAVFYIVRVLPALAKV